MPESEEIARPAFLVLVLAPGADEAARHAAEEGASFLRRPRRTVTLAQDVPAADPPDGLLLVLAQGADASRVGAFAPALKGRAVALAAVADEPPEGAALAQRARKALRAAGALVVERQVVLPRAAFGVYGLESEPLRERLEGVAALLDHEADRLLAKREGWLEPDEDHPDEAVPRVRDEFPDDQ